MLFANEYNDYNTLYSFFSGLFSYIITKMIYLEWGPGDEEPLLKGLYLTN